MITPRLLLCAEYVLTDRDSNNASVINILEEIAPTVLPIIIPRVAVLCIIERQEEDPEEAEILLRLTLHDQIIFEQQIPIDFLGRQRFRQTVLLGGLPITQPGILDVVVFLDDRVLQTYQVPVRTPPRAAALQSEAPEATT